MRMRDGTKASVRCMVLGWVLVCWVLGVGCEVLESGVRCWESACYEYIAGDSKLYKELAKIQICQKMAIQGIDRIEIM